MTQKLDMKGKFIFIDGKVKYDEKIYGYNGIGVVQEEWPNEQLLTVTIERLDGDWKPTVLIETKYVKIMSNKEVLEYLAGEKFNSEDEALDYFSSKFEEKLESFPDAQEAFNDLDDDYNYYLSELGLVYSLFGDDEWNIQAIHGAFVSDNDLATLTNKVMKCMSNVGCDVFTALKLELEDFSELEGLVEIHPEEKTPRVLFLDSII